MRAGPEQPSLASEPVLADRLRRATRTERLGLYTTVYNELFQSLPDHPQLAALDTPEAMAREASRQFGIVRPFLNKDSVVLEIGAGSCHLCQRMAEHVRHVYALDVSDQIATRITLPGNCKLVISDGVSVPVAEEKR